MNIKRATILLALPLLAGCAPEIESTVYVKDVLGPITGGKSVSVPALLRIPQASQDACTKGLDALIANLRTLAPVSGKGKCVEKSGDQLAEIETEMVITTAAIGAPEPNLFVLEVEPADARNSYDLSFHLTRPLDEIVKALAANSDEMHPDFDPARFILSFSNDSESSVSLLPDEVFLDGEPALAEMGPTILERRKTVEIKFSDVASVYVSAAHPYRFATVTATP